ncbi:hypothetical protein [Natronospira bacteriovora]|uniref:Uncharacterized protein n=1 Tax=Natronospira bacteriovora TaxID=3069753 RepID=A0ABU0W4U6_9GAMM|nr:hypothetical protein [Natronospira sp. AB-CW4]MDQ2069006.1 hypothetical protein [Natronospira sp. AB-CW4]
MNMNEAKHTGFSAFLFVVLTAGICSATAQAGSEFDLPEGWVPVGDSREAYHLEISEEAGREGRGLRIRSLDSEGGRFGGVAQLIAADDYAGERVRLSGYVRAMSVSGWAGLWLRVDGQNGNQVLAFDNMNNRPIRGDREWDRYEVVVDVSEEAGRVVFGALLSGGGEIHVDAMELEVVDESVPLTRGLPPRQPRNMSF